MIFWHFNNDISCVNISEKYNLYENSFLISNYGFSEFDKDIQKSYIDNVINKYVSNGFMVWNNPKIYKFINKDFKVELERPLTSGTHSPDNHFIYF